MQLRFILRLTLFCSIWIGSAFVLNHFIDKGMKKDRSYELGVWQDIYNGKASADVLVLGASRAWRHISPAILDSTLHTNSYNIGIDAYNFPMIYWRFKIYAQHNTLPKTIILSLDVKTLDKRSDLFKYEQFVPYLSDTNIQAATKGYDGSFNFFDIHVPLVKYRSQYYNSRKALQYCFFSTPARFLEERDKGYYGNPISWDGNFEKNIKANFSPQHPYRLTKDPESVARLHEFLAFCKEKNIKVIFVNSPSYKPAQAYYDWVGVFDYLKKTALESNNYYLDYANDSISYKQEYFFDDIHLNKNGAETFSRKLAEDLKPLLNH